MLIKHYKMVLLIKAPKVLQNSRNHNVFVISGGFFAVFCILYQFGCSNQQNHFIEFDEHLYREYFLEK